MSFEYVIYLDDNENTFLAIAEKIMNGISTAKLSDDLSSLWIPSIDPKWIDFSIERTDDGFFIVTNLSGSERNKIFTIIESTFKELEITYSIEDA